MNNLKRTIRVVGAAIVDNGRVLVARRPFSDKAYKSLKWEFPGGKIEPGESGPEALVRECREELGADIRVLSAFMDVTHAYPELTVHLTLYESELASGEVHRLEHSDIRFITPQEIDEYDFCPADQAFCAEIKRRRSAG